MKTLKPKEAITILEEMKVNISIPKAAVTQIKRNAALNMAIDALLKCSKIPNDSDTISRQAAIDAVRHAWAKGLEPTQFLEDLPSAQPERKTGVWNIIQGDIVVCSKCGMGALRTMTGCLVNRHLEPNRTNFCPNCGADMRGEE